MFTETLNLELKLTIDKFNLEVPGGDIKNFEISMCNYGFEARVDFWISTENSEDSLAPLFTGQEPIKAMLVVRGCNLPTPAPAPLIVQGLVMDKSFYDLVIPGEDKSYFRRYSIHFADPARVLWKQHFPIALYADGTMEDLIKRQAVKGVSLKMEWSVLQTPHPILCLSMGDVKSETSFYDFLMWFIDLHNGVFNYEHHTNIYKISGEKNGQGLPTLLDIREIDKVEAQFPKPPRHDVCVLNSCAKSAKREKVEQEHSVDGVRQDVMIRSAIASDLSDRKTLETGRLKIRDYEIFLEFHRFPNIAFRPGKFYAFGPEWKLGYTLGNIYRLYQIEISGKAENQEPQNDCGTPKTGYRLEMTARMEKKDEPVVNRPVFKAPHYPIYAEARMLCSEGETSDKTYQFNEDSQTSLHYYKVVVPIWNQEIIVPYNPNTLPGHLYFPIYKDSRLLLSIYFQNAEIDRVLDWGSGVRVPQDTQGNHILFGKNSLSQTSLKHVYEDNKPALHIKRSSDKDTQFIEITEGCIALQTYEDEDAKETEEQFDVTPRADMAQGELTMKSEGAMSAFSSDFGVSKAGVVGDVAAATSDVGNELDSMDSEISDKANSVESELKSATSQLGKTASALKKQATSFKSELKNKLK